MEKYQIELLDCSDEILLEIFKNFNDIDILNAHQVCKRFKTIAKDTFAERYNGDSNEKYYEIKLYSDDGKEDQRFYRTFLKAFGNQMIALKLTAERRSNKYNMLKLISQHCKSTKYLIIANNGYAFNITQIIQLMHNLIHLQFTKLCTPNFYWADLHLPYLETFVVEKVQGINVEVLIRFIYINPQVKHLILDNCHKLPLKTIQAMRDKLKRLKTLAFWTDFNEFSNKCRDINFEQLNSLKIAVNSTSFQNVLPAIARGSKMIRSLSIMWFGDSFDSKNCQLFEIIRLFDQLKLLRLNDFILSVRMVQTLVSLLPNLVTLHLDYVQLDQLSSDDILMLFRKSVHLTDLYLCNYDNNIKTQIFSSQFHHKFVDIIRNRGCNVKCELVQYGTKILINNEKITKNDEIIYSIEFDKSIDNTKVQFLDLSDECLGKLCSYLDERSIRVLYETCTQTKKAVQQQIMEQIFIITDINNAKDTFNRFGEHITKLSIDINTNRDPMDEVWALLNETCGENIIELSLNNIRADATDLFKLRFPNLNVLKIASVHILPPMKCPKLSQLEFNEGKITMPANVLQFGISFDHLTTIRLNYFSDAIGTILYILDDNICDQIEEFTVDPQQKTQLARRRLVNIASRFRNLTTLNLILDIEKVNTKFLFETCTKLTKLSLGYSFQYMNDNWLRMLQQIKKNCKQLKLFQLCNSDIYSGLNYDLLIAIADTLSNVKFNIVSYDIKRNIRKIDVFKKSKNSEIIKAY